MILGDPYKFAIIVKTIKEWNIDDAFCNGVLLFCINGNIFPKEIFTATLKSEIRPLKEKLEALTVEKTLFHMEKEKAFKKIYNITFLEDWDKENDYRFDITPLIFADKGCYVFAVSNGRQVRILAAELSYIIEKSRHDLNKIQISEAILTHKELSGITSHLKIY
ncbi:hypothetical protein D5278_16345 [bacterium 1XD21-13]|nr:hypothetical protein [bacterium 1XD21-13]